MDPYDEREWYDEFYEGMRDIAHKFCAFLAIICTVGACVAVGTMDKPSTPTFVSDTTRAACPRLSRQLCLVQNSGQPLVGRYRRRRGWDPNGTRPFVISMHPGSLS
jgi:hypothetical protein